MRKLCLFLATTFIALQAGAQERNIMSGGPQSMASERELSFRGHQPAQRKSKGAAKTTGALERWYNYADIIDKQARINFSIGASKDSVR